MALLGTLLAEEGRNPQLLERFRCRLVKARRERLAGPVSEQTRPGSPG